MLTFNFSPFPVLQTERMLLRRLTKADSEQMLILRSDDRVMQYIEREKTTSLHDAEAFIDRINIFGDSNESIMWAIALKDSPQEMIGTICFWRLQPENHRAEVGYVLHPDHWNKGIMYEALLAVIGYGFDSMNLHSIEAHINPGNLASARLLEKAGFIREGYYRENIFFGGRFLDTAAYSLLKN